MLNDLDFEHKIKNMGDRELLEFSARQVWETCQRCERHEKRIKTLEMRPRYEARLTGATTGGGLALIVIAVEYLLRRMGWLE